MESSQNSSPKKVLVAVSLMIAGLVVFAIINPLVKIKSGTKGVVFDWGAVQDQTLAEGLHWRIPLMQRVKRVDVTINELSYMVPVGDDGAITKDNQTIGADTVMFYRWDQDKLPEIERTWGYSNVISQLQTALKQSFKESIGSYTIFEVATKQEEIRNKVWEEFISVTSEYPVLITDLRIQNYNWSERFDNQIQATMDRAQQVKQAEQELLLTEQQAQKQVKEAEAEKTALITKAEGKKEAAALNAEAKALEGAGIRKYNESVQANMALEVKLRELEIAKIKASRFNGWEVSPQVYLPFGADANQQIVVKP